MKKLSPREKWLLAIGVVVIVAGGVFWRRSSSDSKPRGVQESPLAELQKTAAKADRSERTFASYDRLAAMWGVPPGPSDPGQEANRLTKMLYDAARQGVAMQRISQAGTQKIRRFKDYDKVVLRADISAQDLTSLMKFLNALEASAGFLAIEDAVIRAPAKPGMPLTGRVAVSAFARKPAEKEKS